MGSRASSAGSECRRFWLPRLPPDPPPAPALRVPWGVAGGRPLPLLPDPAAACAAAAAATSACHLCWNGASAADSDSAFASPEGVSFFCFRRCSGTSMESTLGTPQESKSRTVFRHHMPLTLGFEVVFRDNRNGGRR